MKHDTKKKSGKTQKNKKGINISVIVMQKRTK